MSDSPTSSDASRAQKPARLSSRKRQRRIKAWASHAFLLVISITMVAPFLWMVATSLKPKGQTLKVSWMPTREFVVLQEGNWAPVPRQEGRVEAGAEETEPVELNGREWEVFKRARAQDGAGLYRVRVRRPTAHRGEEFDVSTDELTPELMRDDHFAWKKGRDKDAEVWGVQLVEKIRPETLEVEIIIVPAGEKVEVSETDCGPVEKIETVPAKTRSIRISETELVTRVSPRWGNFKKAWTTSGVFGRAFINSLLIAVLITIGQVFTSSLAAYAFSRLEFPGRDKLFLGYLATMMIPGAVTMIPLFVILKGLPGIGNYLLGTDWFSSEMFVRWWLASPVKEFYAGKLIGLDSYFALITPGLFSAYGTFMLRQFFMSIPRDLEDAARIDGCGTWGVYWRVVLPLSKAALATLGILTFMGAWRGFLWPMVVTSSPEMQTLPVMLQAFMGVTGTQWELMMAGTLIVMAPMILVFLLGQRFFVEGIKLGALKG